MSVRTIRRGGSRFYVDPRDEHRKVPGVTSVVGMLPKPFLTFWAAKLTAEAAVDNMTAVASIAERDREGAVDYLKNSHRRYTKSRADVGSMAHDAFERIMRGENVGRVHPDIREHVRHFSEFMTMVNPELLRAEDVAWNEEHEYAGSFDAILRVWLDEDGRPTPDRSGEPHTVLTDWKTSKDTYPDVALQLAAYAACPVVIDANGNESSMPVLDGAAVLHVTEQQWSWKPVDIGDQVFDHFLALRSVFSWEREVSKRVIGKPLVSGGRLVTGTERRG